MVLFAALVGQFNVATYWRLATRSVSVQGTVLQVLPKVHATVRYRYDVNGRDYYGQSQPGRPNPAIGRLSEGVTLTVWYDPAAPDRSVVASPSGLLHNEVISVAAAAILFPTFILLVWRYRMLAACRRLLTHLRGQSNDES
jgi:hypothetical protein